MRCTRIASVLILSSFIYVSAVAAGDSGADPGGYKLIESSTYQFGCFDPCMCPILLQQGMSGTFELAAMDSSDPGVVVFAVSDVGWAVPFGDLERLLTGSGTYSVANGDPPQQRMELDLQTDGGAVEHFDSGWVEVEVGSPGINVSVSINGMFCFDTVLSVEAVLADPADLDADGAVGSADLAMLLGAWGPCSDPQDCPADLDGDTHVGATDLAMLLGEWMQ